MENSRRDAPSKLTEKDQKPRCPDCGSERIWKDGLRYLDGSAVQRYLCRDCGFRFSESTAELKVKINIPPKPIKLLDPAADLADVVVGQAKLAIEKPLNIPPLLRSEDVASHGSSHVSVVEKDLNPSHIYSRDRQVCVALAEGTKNLVKVESRIEKRAAGATKPTEADVKGKIIEHLWWLKKEAYAESTIKQRIYMLKTLRKLGADLLNPESVKETVAKQQNWSEGYKLIAVTAYNLFAEMLDIEFHPPRYRTQQKLPFIPLESEIDQLIAGCGKKTSTFLQTLKETGMRPGEAKRLKWTNVDTVNNTITLNQPEKRGNPRMFKVSKKLVMMLKGLPKKSERVFGESSLRSLQGTYLKSRKHIAKKLNNPRLARITFRTLRHWKATMEYHRTKDILHVKNLLGHKKIENTLKYTQLVTFETEDQFTCKVAKTLEEAKELVETGFEYVTDMNGTKLFRKRK